MHEDICSKLQDLLKKATKLGADEADAVYLCQESLSYSQRLGNTENIERAENADIGLRVFVGKRQSVVSSSDQTSSALTDLAERAEPFLKTSTVVLLILKDCRNRRRQHSNYSIQQYPIPIC